MPTGSASWPRPDGRVTACIIPIASGAAVEGIMPEDYRAFSRVEYTNVIKATDAGYGVGASLGKTAGDAVNDLYGSIGLSSLGSMQTYLSEIAENTGEMVTSLDMSKDEIAYLRDVADGKTIANNSTSTVKIDMTNNNSMNNGYDADLFINRLTDELEKKYRAAAKGNHA